MKKVILSSISFLIFFIIATIIYLSTIGYETDKFNQLLEKNISSNVPNTKINIDKIKIKINIKNLSFFVTTIKPNIRFNNYKLNINKIDAFIDLKSLLSGNPRIKKINISSNDIDVSEIKNIVKYSKPSSFKKFFLNEVETGNASLNLDLDLVNNKIVSYEINGAVKNLFAKAHNINFKKTSFVYLIRKNSSEIDNIRGFVNGFQINSGNVEFENLKSLKIKGNLKSDFKLSKNDINKFMNKKKLKDYKNVDLLGKVQSLFKINFDKTLKIVDYQIEASGNIQKSEIKLNNPKKYFFLKNKIKNLSLEKTEFNIDFSKDSKKSINLIGLYKFNKKLFQKFNFENSYDAKLKKYFISGDFDGEIFIPQFNFISKNKIVNINTSFETNKNIINLKEFHLKEGKNKIDINNLIIKNNKLEKFDNISVKTFANNKFNNDFTISFDKEIKIGGSKYDASYLTKFLEQNDNSEFLKNISKEISVNIKEISTKFSDTISNFNLIGFIDKGKFNKIVSKGEFKDGKYLDISLRTDKTSKKKVLEIYSDFPEPLISNYKFFKGISGGQLLLFSSYDSQISNTKLIIENFKVKKAPGLVKLLSLADFGGMVDALSGEGLSFDKLEMSLVKNDQVLNLKELYAIGPSISILMEGYVESKTGLVSLRGTMVPAKTLNKFLSKLPIIGEILIPKEIGEGLFGISFKMKGEPENIKTTVNPIKTLTPRFIQKALEKSK